MWCKLTTNVDLTIKNEYQIQLQFDTHLGLHFHFLYSKTELLKYLGACSYECAKHERNRYVQANNISDNEWQQRLTNFDDLHQHA